MRFKSGKSQGTNLCPIDQSAGLLQKQLAKRMGICCPPMPTLQKDYIEANTIRKQQTQK